MQKLIFLLLLIPVMAIENPKPAENIPAALKGNFTDDYGIKYTINDTLWVQHPRSRFHIIRWNVKDQYLIAKNDDGNPGEGGQYTRIDFMQFSGMEPWRWGFCLTAYNAKTDAVAEATAKADRQHPKTGCNGFPFSRMKRTDQ